MENLKKLSIIFFLLVIPMYHVQLLDDILISKFHAVRVGHSDKYVCPCT